MVRDSKFSLTINPEACILAAAMLLLIPLQWASAWLLSALVHEMSHCLALWVCGRHIYGIRVGINGAEIQTQTLTEGESLLCSLAGPAGGMLLLLWANVFPRLAVCAFLQSVFNLFPVYPLDGGRALRGLVGLLFPENSAMRISVAVERCFCVILLIGLLAAGFWWKLGVMPAILILLFFIHVKKIKIPCKEAIHGVQ